MHPAPIEAVPVALGVLAVAGVLEGYTMKVAWAELEREARKAGWVSVSIMNTTPIPFITSTFDLYIEGIYI